MSTKNKVINILIGFAYLVLIGLLVFNIFELSDKYNREEMNMIVALEKKMKAALELPSDNEMISEFALLREDEIFDIVVTRANDVIYNTVPYEIGDSLVNRSHFKTVARESQGPYYKGNDELFVWYSIYKLNDSVFLRSFLTTLVITVMIIALLGALTVIVISKSLFDPLKNIKKSIQLAKEYEFNKITETDDAVNKDFKTFVNALESNISAVSRQHTELEKQLQAKREHLNNIVVVSRSMVHDLKTPVHRNILENEVASKEKSYNSELVELANLNEKLNHNIMLDINRILKMLKDDSEQYEPQVSDVEIVSSIMRAVKSFGTSISNKGLQIDYNTPEEVILRVEETTFILLVNNLLSNMVLYALENSELSIEIVDDIQNELTLRFRNYSEPKNIERMNSTKQLFNTVKDQTNDEYIYRSGNGLYLINELSKMMDAEYTLTTDNNIVTIEVTFKYEA